MRWASRLRYKARSWLLSKVIPKRSSATVQLGQMGDTYLGRIDGRGPGIIRGRDQCRSNVGGDEVEAVIGLVEVIVRAPRFV